MWNKIRFIIFIISTISMVHGCNTSIHAQELPPLMLQQLRQHFNEEMGKWQDSYRLLPVYDQKGRKIHESGYEFYRSGYFEDCDSTWLIQFEENWKYNEKDSLMVHERKEYSYTYDYNKEGCNIFTNYYLNREEYSYRKDGLLNQEVLTNENKYEENEISGNITTINYIYDENNCLYERHSETITTYSDINQQSTRYIRDSNCNLLYQENDHQKIEFNYNDSFQLIEMKNYFYNLQNGQWTLIQEIKMEYWETGIIKKRIEKEHQDFRRIMTITMYDEDGHQVLKTYFSLDDGGFISDTLRTIITRWDDLGKVIYESHYDEYSQFILTYDYVTNNNNQITQETLSIQTSRHDSTVYSSYGNFINNEYDAVGNLITKNRIFSSFSYDNEYWYESSGESWEYYKYRCDGVLVERLVESSESTTYNHSNTYENTSKFRELSSYSPAFCAPIADPMQVTIYPNPSKGLVNIMSELLHKPGTTIAIYDTMGRNYFLDLSTIGHNGMIDLGYLDPGLYIITLSNPPNRASGRVIVNP